MSAVSLPARKCAMCAVLTVSWALPMVTAQDKGRPTSLPIGGDPWRTRARCRDDDGATWRPLREITDQAELPQWRWYATGPGHPAARALLTLRAGRDGGLTWPTAHAVSGLPGACSDLVRLDPDTVGLLPETGDFSAYSTITFRRIPVEEPR